MKKEIDKKIREKARDEKLKMPSSYINKVNCVLGELPDTTLHKNSTRISFRPSMAIFIAIITLFSVTVFATKDLLQDRLHFMSGSEKKKYVEEVQQSNVEVELYSRNMTYEQFVSNGGVTKEEAVEIARDYVKKVYEADSSEYKSSIEFDDGEKEYYVCLTDSNNDRKFEVWLNAETGDFKEIAWFQEEADDYAGIKVNEKEYTDYYEKVYDLMKNKMGIWNDIESVYCYYNEKTGGTHYKADGTLWKTSVSYVLKTKGNQCYIIDYSCKNKRIQYLFTMDYKQYQNSHNKEVEADKMKDGITRKEIKLYEAKDENEMEKTK